MAHTQSVNVSRWGGVLFVAGCEHTMYFCALLHRWNILTQATVIKHECLIDLATLVRVQAQRPIVILPLLCVFLASKCRKEHKCRKEQHHGPSQST